MSRKKFSVRQRLRSFVYAFRGIGEFFGSQHNGWIHLAAALVAIALGCWLHIDRTEWAIIAICIGVVFAAEIFNTAIEYLVDKVSPGHDQKAGLIKDLAAAAVLIVALTALVVGLLIFWPHLVEKFQL